MEKGIIVKTEKFLELLNRLQRDNSLREIAKVSGVDHSIIARIVNEGYQPSYKIVNKVTLAFNENPIDYFDFIRRDGTREVILVMSRLAPKKYERIMQILEEG